MCTNTNSKLVEMSEEVGVLKKKNEEQAYVIGELEQKIVTMKSGLDDIWNNITEKMT